MKWRHGAGQDCRCVFSKHPRLRLRPLCAADATDIARLISNREVLRWLVRPPSPYGVADATAFITLHLTTPEAERPMVRAISFADDAQLIGIASIESGARGPELGYWLGQSYWGRGLMSEAARALTQHFFANPDNMALQSAYISGNEASAAIQRRLGFEIQSVGTVHSRPLGIQVSDVKTRLTRARHEMLKR